MYKYTVRPMDGMGIVTKPNLVIPVSWNKCVNPTQGPTLLAAPILSTRCLSNNGHVTFIVNDKHDE